MRKMSQGRLFLRVSACPALFRKYLSFFKGGVFFILISVTLMVSFVKSEAPIPLMTFVSMVLVLSL